MTTLYDNIGRTYSGRRQSDPRIAMAIEHALGDCVSVLNVGAGAGSGATRWVYSGNHCFRAPNWVGTPTSHNAGRIASRSTKGWLDPIMELSQYKDVSVLKRYACLGLLSAGAGLAGALSTSAFADGKRHFDTRDSIEISYFGTLSSSSAPLDIDDDGIVSPDGRWVVKVTHRGVLPEGVTEGTLWLFHVAEIKRSINNPKIAVPTPVAPFRV